MAITYRYARCFHGQPVVVHLHDGRRYHGFVRHVTVDGIYMEPYRGVRPISSNDKELEITTADQSTDMEIDEVLWGWWFFPFFTLLALSPLLWW